MFLPNVVTSAATCTLSADYKRQSQVQDMYLVEKSRCNKHLQLLPVPAPLLRTVLKARELPGCRVGNPPLPSPCTESPPYPALLPAPEPLFGSPPRSPDSQHFTEFVLCPPRPLRPWSAAPARGQRRRQRDRPGLLPAAGGDPRHCRGRGSPAQPRVGIPGTAADKLREPPAPSPRSRPPRPGTAGPRPPPAPPSSGGPPPGLPDTTRHCPSRSDQESRGWKMMSAGGGLRQGCAHPGKPPPRSPRPPPAALRGRGGRDAPPGDAAAAAPA